MYNVRVDRCLKRREWEELVLSFLETCLLTCFLVVFMMLDIRRVNVCSCSIVSIKHMVIESRKIGSCRLHTGGVSPAYAVCKTAALGEQFEFLLLLHYVESTFGRIVCCRDTGTLLDFKNGLETLVKIGSCLSDNCERV